MKIGTFSKNGKIFTGIVEENKIFDLTEFSAGFKNIKYTDIGLLFKEGLFSTDFFKEIMEEGKNYENFRYPLQNVFFAPLYKPGKIICLGRNYVEHAKETDAPVPEEPVYFEKATSAVIAHSQPIIYPGNTGRVDPEVELAVVIGKKAKNIKEDKIKDFIAGYTILNDVTARDMQTEDMRNKLPWYRSKSIDTFCPVGPWIVTSDEIKMDENLKIQLRVNGEIRQNSSTGNMIFKISSLVSKISSLITLEPGDIVSTGTPEGIAPVYPGDVVECEIEKIGILKNPVENFGCNYKDKQIF